MRFLDTLFRHRIIAAVPLVLGLVVAIGFVEAQPRVYQSTASVWVSTTVGGTNNNTGSQYVAASTQQKGVLTELLSTRAFTLAVAHRGSLYAYLTSHPNAGQTGLGAIPGIGKLFASSLGSIDDQIAASLPAAVTINVTGPNVLTLTIQGPDAAVTEATAKALLYEYPHEVLSAAAASDRQAVDYYSQQVAGSEATLQQANTALSTYLKTHPKVPGNGAGDATGTRLNQVVVLAQSSYATLLGQYEQAQLNLSNVPGTNGISVIDAPLTPTGPVSVSKKVLAAGVVGGLLGLLVSVIVISLLASADHAARREDDIKRQLGLDVAATIDRFPDPRGAIG
jgi:uncharacterized protein involved in exopolysaccharide biosynthesis